MNTVTALDFAIRNNIPQTSGQSLTRRARTRHLQTYFEKRKSDTTSRLPIKKSHYSFEEESGLFHRGLVGMSRGLLQYASQCSLWTPADQKRRRQQLDRLVAKQQESIQRLSELLNQRRHHVNWGAFPIEYTRYNYVALEFLWPNIADFQVQLVRMLEAIRNELQHNDPATGVLDDVLQTEQEISAELAQATPFPERRSSSRDRRSIGTRNATERVRKAS